MSCAVESDSECAVQQSFHRRKAKWKQMFLNSLGNFTGLGVKQLHVEKRATGSDIKSYYTLHGLFLVLDHRGRKVNTQFLDVQYIHGLAQGEVTFNLRNRSDNSREKLEYIWTNNGRWIRIKSPPPKRNEKEHSRRQLVHKKPQQNFSDLQSNLVLKWSKKGRDGYCSHGAVEHKQPEVETPSDSSHDSSEDEDSGPEFPEEPHRKRPYIKSINRSFKRYLLGRGSVNRNTKAWSREMKTLMSSATQENTEQNIESYDNDELRHSPRQTRGLTFGDFFRAPILKHRNEKRPVDTANETLLPRIEPPSLMTISTHSEVDHTQNEKREARNGPVLSTKSDSSMSNVMVRLLRGHARPDILSSEFKLDYREAPCKPRRFLLNISRLLYQHIILMSRLRLKHIPRLDLSTYLVFTFSQTISPEVDEYRLHVNSAWSKLSTRVALKGLNASEPFTPIQELIHEVIHAVDGIDLNQFKPRKNTRRSQRPSRPVSLFNTLSSVARWETAILNLPFTTEWYEEHIKQLPLPEPDSSSGVIEDIFDILRHKIEYDYSGVNFGPNSSQMCGVCLSEFNSGKTLETRSFPLALTLCSHWFCEECWKAKVLIQLRNGLRPREVPCPEKGCLSRLDPVTMLCVLNVEDIRRMKQISLQNYLTTQKRVKICPNSSCHRLLWTRPRDMSSKTPVIVTCDCSTQICFDCQLQPHWPAPCSIAKRYHQELSSNNHEVLGRLLSQMEFPEVVMRGKKCPKCKLFISQSNSMKIYNCSCGCQFCWGCGLEILNNEVAHKQCVESFIHSDNVLKDIVNNGQLASEQQHKTSRWYGTALAHRKMRHPEVVLAMYTMAESMAKNISHFHQNGRYVGDIDSAVQGWNKYLVKWAKENYENMDLDVSKENTEGLQKHDEDCRSVSRASSLSSLFHDSEVFDSPLTIATENIVQMKLELHCIIEYTAVLLDHVVPAPAKLVQCLERAEDLSTALGILLQNKQNCRQVLPAFLRLEAKVRQIIGHILTTIEEIPPGVFQFDEDKIFID
uniref:RBR-type E3 ubiquitin transferase n=1 Tax=Biomphalaria glabrata TaxID=6526 RepID=A0A2C9L232_BIOGL